MTVARTAIGDCVLQMCGALGEAGVFAATGKTVDALRKASNPHEARRLALDDAVRLAAACDAHGHGHGLFEALAAVIKAEARAMGGTGGAPAIGPDAHLRRLAAEIGDVNREVDRALKDGRLTGPERTRICAELGDLVEQGLAMRAELEALS